jgi:putative glycosyltransferase (TIGR04348 family)
MDILIVTPAGRRARTGNRTTAVRWQRLLRRLGHRVAVTTDYGNERADLLIAIHAWRSAAAVERFRARYPDRALVVGLGGTDINEFLKTHPKTTLATMEAADMLVGLHNEVDRAIPSSFHSRLRIILQSAEPLPKSLVNPSRRNFDVAVIAHLREVKDPLRSAFAARLLPDQSRLRIIHLGKAYDAAWAARAADEAAANRRYLWRGEASFGRVRALLGRSHALVVSSLQEGGANVVSEAVVAGVPVIASHIPGNTGLLGADYPGTFPVGDTKALARLLGLMETDAGFRRELARHCRLLAAQFRPQAEQRAWKELLRELE